VNGEAAVVAFSLVTQSFSDIQVVSGSTASVDGFFNQYDGVRDPLLSIMVSESSDGFELATLSAPFTAVGIPDVISTIDDEKVIAADGVLAYQANNDWLLYVQPESLQNSIGLPIRTPISLSGLLAQQGFSDIVIDRVTDLITKNTGDLVIVADVTLSGVGPFTLALMASDPTPLKNEVSQYDVNRDQFINAIDALVVINELNRNDGSRPISTKDVHKLNFRDRGVRGVYLDSNGDGFINAIDALIVINYLNREGPGGVGNGEGEGVDQIASQLAHRYHKPVEHVEALIASSDLVSWLERKRRTTLGASYSDFQKSLPL
jgi:hypothetical protein